MVDVYIVNLPLDECRSTLLMISQHWFRQWLGAFRQQAITWANGDPDLCRHIASLGPNSYHIEADTKWPPCRGQNFEMHEKCSIVIWIPLKFVPKGPTDNRSTWQQAFNWTNADPVHWRIYGARGDELINPGNWYGCWLLMSLTISQVIYFSIW